MIFSQQTVGVIYRTERNAFRVLDQLGQTRLVMPHQITMRRDGRRTISTDHNGHELRVGDNVKEVDGEVRLTVQIATIQWLICFQNRRGVVLHIHQGHFAFLHNREMEQNGGIFVVRCRSLEPIASKTGAKVGPDLSKMNPALNSAQGGAPSMARGPRDRLIGVNVAVIKGPHKGFIGTIKDVNGDHCRVEIHTQNRIITIEKAKLRRRKYVQRISIVDIMTNTLSLIFSANGQLEPLESFGKPFAPPGLPRSASIQPFGGQYTPSGSNRGSTTNPYSADGGRTPGWGNDGGRTPGWGTSGRTPNPYADSSRTPAWTASSQTPNPYADGSRTPAWTASSSRTPNPYSATDGSRTPGPWGVSARTPNQPLDGGKTPTWNAGGQTPNPYNNRPSATGPGGETPSQGWGAAATGSATPGWARTSGNATPGWSQVPGGTTPRREDGGWVSLQPFKYAATNY